MWIEILFGILIFVMLLILAYTTYASIINYNAFNSCDNYAQQSIFCPTITCPQTTTNNKPNPECQGFAQRNGPPTSDGKATLYCSNDSSTLVYASNGKPINS